MARPTDRWRYALLVEDIEVDGFHCESYGILIVDQNSGAETAVRHITINATQALELLNMTARLAVSPSTLNDVVEDFLGW